MTTPSTTKPNEREVELVELELIQMGSLGDTVAETAPNFFPRLWATLILDGIMQQRRNGFVLVSTMFDHQGRDGQQVRNVGDAGTLPALLSVELGGEDEGLFKAAGHWNRH